MIQSEAKAIVAMLMELWPSKFHWTPGIIGIWVESLARDDLNANQCTAVIRQMRREDDSRSPSIKRVLARCHEVHKTSRPASPSRHTDVTPEQWAEIHRDRQAAAAWWHEVRESGEAQEVVRLATLAYPMWPTRWAKFLDAGYKPKPIACMALMAAWQEFHDTGARPKPEYEPGVMASATRIPA